MSFESTARRQRAKAELSHRHSNGYACAMCGDSERDLAFSVLVHAYPKDAPFDNSFVPLSAGQKTISGCFPLCTVCAPSCSRCQLPIATKRVHVFGDRKHATIGDGVCQHKGLKDLLQSLIEKAKASS